MHKLIAKIRELAEQYPNAVYQIHNQQGCFYTVGEVENGPDTSGCLIGQAIAQVYPELFNELVICDVQPPDIYSSNTIGCMRILKWFNDIIDMSEHEMSWCSVVQSNQDHQSTWGQAVLDINL